jgi:hypothetical protein
MTSNDVSPSIMDFSIFTIELWETFPDKFLVDLGTNQTRKSKAK